MFLHSAIFLSLIMNLHRTGARFLRFNHADHVTAPIDLDDLIPGSYDDLLNYNPSLGAPYEAISYGGDDDDGNRKKAFDWSAPEIEAQTVMLVPEHKESPTNATEDIEADAFSLPVLVHKSGNKSYYVLAKINEQNDTDKKEVSGSIEPGVRRSNSYTILAVGDSRKRSKTRTYSIKTPRYELTYHGYTLDGYADHDYTLSGDLVSSCYRCGELNYGKWWRPSVEARERKGKIIPKSSLCSEAFGDNWEFKTKARYLRSRCYNNEKQKYKYKIGADNFNFYHECAYPLVYKFGRNHTKDRGSPLECFGRYTGRCFKRFLDVGKEYIERGCASWPPHQSNSFASHRFTKMEYLLYKKDNACVSSPLASLTPFARGISLYVRYHVCVCKGKYCNTASDVSATPLLLLFTTYISINLIPYNNLYL